MGKDRIFTENKIIRVASLNCKIGPLFIAASTKGIRVLSFEELGSGVKNIKHRYPQCSIQKDMVSLKKILNQIILGLKNGRPLPSPSFDLTGTPFQMAVWKTLLRIPKGKVLSYAKIASKIGRRHAARAVGNACAQNPIAILVPCHRVIRSNGTVGGYAWGQKIKIQLLKLEKYSERLLLHGEC